MTHREFSRRELAFGAAAIVAMATITGETAPAHAVPPLVFAVVVVVSVISRQAVQKVALQVFSSGASKAAAKEVAKRFIASLPRYSPDVIKTADHLLLRAVPDKTITKDGLIRHWYIKGNPDDIFRQITRGAVRISDTQYRDGVKNITLYNATSNNAPTIAINTAFQQNKVRIINELAE